jgi:hypothetical protein
MKNVSRGAGTFVPWAGLNNRDAASNIFHGNYVCRGLCVRGASVCLMSLIGMQIGLKSGYVSGTFQDACWKLGIIETYWEDHMLYSLIDGEVYGFTDNNHLVQIGIATNVLAG